MLADARFPKNKAIAKPLLSFINVDKSCHSPKILISQLGLLRYARKYNSHEFLNLQFDLKSRYKVAIVACIKE